MVETAIPQRILIAEDDGIIAARLQSILTKMGYTVPAVVASGEEAVRQAAEAPPDLALLDIRLAGDMDGIQAGAQMRARWGTPLVYLTAYMDDNLLQRARVTEPYGYLVKPIQDRELRATIEIALYRHRTDRQLRESEERYRAVVSQAVESILLFDLETGQLLEANPACQRLLGYADQDIPALSVYDVLAAERAGLERDIAAVVQDRQRALGARQCRRKDGALVDVQASASLIACDGRPAICLLAHFAQPDPRPLP
jgi:PAS domain S-box-containing protein